jgi:hypothetical protein
MLLDLFEALSLTVYHRNSYGIPIQDQHDTTDRYSLTGNFFA